MRKRGFGVEGKRLSSQPTYRAVTTERMIGRDGPGTKNELTLTAVADGTLLSLLIAYPNAELRDVVLGPTCSRTGAVRPCSDSSHSRA